MSPSRGSALVSPPPAAGFEVPRPLRALLMAVLFMGFFLGSPLIALVLFPVLRLVSGKKSKKRATWLLHRGMAMIAGLAKGLGIVRLDLPPPPSTVDLEKPHVMISNHPTYIDMIVILGAFGHLTCVTNGRWWRHWALGRLLAATEYLPGPGSGLPESEHMLETMVGHLKDHALLIFPEGQRSLPTQLRRFRRGAVEAATKADVPIVPLFLSIDQPYLTKSVSIWNAPKHPPTYRFEWFDAVIPSAFDHDTKRIQKHLEALYDARFQIQQARHAALLSAESSLGQSQKS